MQSYWEDTKLKSNLGRNSRLCLEVLNGAVTPDELATMSADDMADDKLIKEREKAKEEADKHATLAGQSGGPRYRRTHKGDENISMIMKG